MNIIRKATAYVLLFNMYSVTWLVAKLSSAIPRRSWRPTGRIIVAGTFHNPNWYLSHVTPLVRADVEEVILLADEPQLPIEGVRFVCWPRWFSRVLSRPFARAISLLIAGLRYRPDLYVGYHLGPGACTVLMVGKIMGRPACYQMTGGPVEIMGGGVDAAEGIGAPLGRPSRMIERMALAVVRQFDLVVVRGTGAKKFLADHGIERSVAIITGSVQDSRQSSVDRRDIHLIFVGRLSIIKQVDQFIDIVNSLKQSVPEIRATIVGNGPLRENLQNRVQELGLAANIEFLGQRKDVGSLLHRAKIFVLTSQSEGLSIAMAEAMRAGAVPVVSNVGDLGDLVTDGVSGHLVEPGNIAEYAKKIRFLLQNEAIWTRFSGEATKAASEHCDIEVVSEKWRRCLRDTVHGASGCCAEEIVD